MPLSSDRLLVGSRSNTVAPTDGMNEAFAACSWDFFVARDRTAELVRETLEEAVFYLAMVGREPGLTTLGAIEAEMAEIRANAAKPTFPKLLEQVNAGLTEPMAFDAEFLSLQKARNCLEHRGGRVGTRDVDAATGTLTLSFPRLRTFYRRGHEEVELAPGEVIDTHSPDNPFGKGEEVPIFLNRVTRSREYALGEPIIITASDFYEIAMACQLFASDVAAKLPTLPPIVETRVGNMPD